jgi:hypothetical protein
MRLRLMVYNMCAWIDTATNAEPALTVSILGLENNHSKLVSKVDQMSAFECMADSSQISRHVRTVPMHKSGLVFTKPILERHV